MKKSGEIYDHLAKVYFDSSRDKKKRHAYPNSIFKILFVSSIAVITCLIIVIFMITTFQERLIPEYQRVLILGDNTTSINYDFNQIKKEVIAYDLKNMNLCGLKTLCFRTRRGNYRGNLHMGVGFVSNYGEISQIYIKQIPNRWRNLKINLTEFKNISDWSHMQQLLFVLEEWNAQVKKGIIYIDDVRFLK